MLSGMKGEATTSHQLSPATRPSNATVASMMARRAALAVQPTLKPLEALGAGECRWPYGDAHVRFCGQPTLGPGPYCRAHRGLAYVADAGGYDLDALANEIDRRDRRLRATAA